MSATENPHPAPQPSLSGRDAHGRFTANNPGGPCNPFARRVAQLRTALLDTVRPEDITAIFKALIERACQGDVAAAKVVLAYGLGKPAPAVNPDRLDVEEWQHFKETTGMIKDAPGMVLAPAPELPLQLVRALRPVMAVELGGQVKDMVRELRAAAAAQAKQGQAPPSPNGENSSAAPSPNGNHEPWPPLDFETWAASFNVVAPSPNEEKRPPRHPHG
jgi:hypothetical protein